MEATWALWKAGGAFLIMLAVALCSAGALVAVVLAVAGDVAGFGTDRTLFWTAISLPLWGPFALGYLLQAMPRGFIRSVWAA